MSFINFKNKITKKKEDNKVDQYEFKEGITITEDKASDDHFDRSLLLDIPEDEKTEVDGSSFDISELVDNIATENDDSNADIKINTTSENNKENNSYGDNEIVNFLNCFTSDDDEEIYLTNDPLDIREDIVLDVVEKRSYFKMYLVTITAIVGCMFAFLASYFISQYNIVTEPVNGAVFIIKNKYSVTYKYPVVLKTDVSIDDHILFKEDSKNRFIGAYSQGIVKSVRDRTVRVFDMQTRRYSNVPYEKIWYVIPSDKAFINEINKNAIKRLERKSGKESVDIQDVEDINENQENNKK